MYKINHCTAVKPQTEACNISEFKYYLLVKFIVTNGNLYENFKYPNDIGGFASKPRKSNLLNVQERQKTDQNTFLF